MRNSTCTIIIIHISFCVFHQFLIPCGSRIAQCRACSTWWRKSMLCGRRLQTFCGITLNFGVCDDHQSNKLEV